MRRLIITGDDFGLAVPVNEAIEESHRRGILTTASLMIGAEAAPDAVERARRCPSLKVGLHIVLVVGRPVLPPRAIPDLVDHNGEFSSHPASAGINFFFRAGPRAQLEAEIRAQFELFQKTGLPLDHVNAHCHMHLDPAVSGPILRVGREYGLKAMRVPYEPLIPSWRASRRAFPQKVAVWLALSPWIALLRRRLRCANVHSNDCVFGLYDDGDMRVALVLQILKHLPPGVTEIYFHAATRGCPEIDRVLPGYHYRHEFEALTSPMLQEALLASGVQRIAFSDL